MGRVPEEKDQVRSRFREDFHGFQHRELHGLVLLPKLCEKDGGYVVAEKDGGNVNDESPVSFIPQRSRNWLRKRHHARQERQVETRHREERTGIHPPGIFPLLVGKAEAAGFQTKH